MNSFAKVSFPTPGTLKAVIFAETVLTCSWLKLLSSFAKMMNTPTPGLLKSLILAETVLAFAWRELFEFICKDDHPYSGTIAIIDFS